MCELGENVVGSRRFWNCDKELEQCDYERSYFDEYRMEDGKYDVVEDM